MAVVTADNHGPLLNVAMWIVLVPMIIIALTKMYTKYDTLRKIQMDDYLGLIAMLSSVAQSICTSEQIAHGLGQKQDNMLQSELNRFYIAQYAGNIMYISVIFLTKLSSLYFFVCLTREGSSKRRLIHRSIVVVGIWSVISIIVIALQCQLPHPWVFDPGQCINVRAFWTINAVVDALTQVFTGLLPVYILNGLRMKDSRKRLTILLFSPNLLTLPLLILRIVYLYNTIDSTNYTWDSFNLALITNLQSSFTVILSCIPFTKSIIDSLVVAPHIITDTTSGVLSSNRPKSAGRKNKSYTRGSSHFLSGVAARTTTLVTATGGEAQELNEYISRAESQERMISGPTSPATNKAKWHP
ncbi:hypothetical protein BCIN_12g00850 [Botrytis cinerea B05.10]|uniref:Rhodopsin domain-containing protein n=1 Tax=Botryotinia fuckeliana (strain B05.10) TaxID=332648 RepID=A0A384JYA1_BOTFB|nr:hypothetical protein BCIN_12g00850 [Botrytis cinerea B05.10]ATZ55492.1 hypothetical protein BCIN_12g00850 [Botrytis cinerea B05.10]